MFHDYRHLHRIEPLLEEPARGLVPVIMRRSAIGSSDCASCPYFPAMAIAVIRLNCLGDPLRRHAKDRLVESPRQSVECIHRTARERYITSLPILFISSRWITCVPRSTCFQTSPAISPVSSPFLRLG